MPDIHTDNPTDPLVLAELKQIQDDTASAATTQSDILIEALRELIEATWEITN